MATGSWSGRQPGRRLLPGTAIAMALVLAGCTQSGSEPPKTSAADAKLTEATVQASIEDELKRGDAAVAGKQYELAQRLYSRILREHPTERRALLGLGEVYLAVRDAEKARQTFRLVEAAGDTSGAATQGSGIALLMLNRRDEAVTKLEQAVAKDPSLWRAWNGLAQVHDIKQEWVQARECYDKALAANPQAAPVHNNLGVSLMLQGRMDEAAGAFREALKFAPDMAEARGNLRLALAGEGRYKEALSGADGKTSAEALNNVGFMAMARGDYGVAERMLTEALEQNPSYYEKAGQNLDRNRALRTVRPQN